MPKTKKIIPAVSFVALMGITLPTVLPTMTAMRDVKTRAEAAPINTEICDFVSHAKAKVAICVLSPSSARNTTKKVEKISFKSSIL